MKIELRRKNERRTITNIKRVQIFNVSLRVMLIDSTEEDFMYKDWISISIVE